MNVCVITSFTGLLCGLNCFSYYYRRRFFFSTEDFAIIFLRYLVDCVSPSPSVIVVVIFRFRALYNNFTLLFVAGFAVGVLSIRVSSITRSIIEIQTLFL